MNDVEQQPEAPNAVEHAAIESGVEASEAEPAQSTRRLATTRPRALLGPSPTIAGEAPGAFGDLVEALGSDYPETGATHIRRRWLLEAAALQMLTMRRGALAERCVWNAEIASSVHRRLVDWAAVEVLTQPENDGQRAPTQRDEAIEGTFRQSWWREQEQMARAAVSGDKAAIACVQARLGPDAMTINPRMDFGRVYGLLLSIERVVTPARVECERAFRALEKQQKRAKKHPTKVEPHEIPSQQRPESVETTDVSTSAIVQYVPPVEQTFESVPTVTVPKPDPGDADGGAT